MQNKNTFFRVDVEIPEQYRHSTTHMSELDDGLDLVLYAMQASNNDIYKIVKEDGSKVVLLFRANTRKRKGQLNKFCNCYLDNNITTHSKGILKEDMLVSLAKAKKSPDYELIFSIDDNASYDGDDIKLFKDYDAWFPWQKSVYKMLYEKNGLVKKPHPRKIISLIDYKGCTGKSTFFKYLYVQDKKIGSNNIGRITYGTAMQLRSAIIGLGKKKIYIIDLTRAKSKYDNQSDLLSVIEDCKSGIILSPMYGNPKELIMQSLIY